MKGETEKEQNSNPFPSAHLASPDEVPGLTQITHLRWPPWGAQNPTEN